VVISAIPDGPLGDAEFPQFSPGPLSEILEAIRAERPAFVCAPHVETSTGIMLPDEYIRAIGEATRSVGGVFCLDCIASGCAWVDMESLAVDCIVTAPQKGWSGPACCGIVLLNARARALVEAAPLETETIGSYCCNLKTWLAVMAEYEEGGCTDHTTLPTDALVTFRDVVRETAAFGFGRARQRMMTLGQDVRAALAARGLRSVAAAGFESPGVVVFYASAAAGVPTAGFLVEAMKGRGVQIAGGVPFKLPLLPSTATEPEDFDPRACAFRVGLFGLDKLRDVEHASARFLEHLDAVIGAGAEQRQATAADGAGAGLVSKL
jgi:aspartate aminotransferase-like enzyme